MKVCFHFILHIADSIQNTGPCWSTWQFPMERTCGMLQPFAKLKLHPYKNLANHVYLLELFNNLYYYRKIYDQIFPSISCKEYKEHLVYINQDYKEEFLWPSKNIRLIYQKLKLYTRQDFVKNKRASIDFLVSTGFTPLRQS